MHDKLNEIEERFDELTNRLSDPQVASNPDEYQKIAKQRSDLEELVATWRARKEVQKQIDDNNAIIAAEDDEELRAMAREEVPELQRELEALDKKLRLLLLPKDPNDEKNILLEIRAGTGGEEAALFAADLFRMYSRYAEAKKWKVEILEHSETGIGGIKELIALISGDKVYSHLKYESGVHRVQRVPKTEASGRIHTSACTVAVLPEAEDVDVQIDEKDLRIDVYRSSGPGGQGVNTTDSAVRVTHIPSGLVVACQDERSQHKNKARAMKILKSRLLDHMQQQQDAERSAERRSQVKSGDRSEKIRTYNFPQSRMTDHRIGLTKHNLDAILDGDLEDTIIALREYHQAEAMKSGDAR
jgi:peptide chain release factor 1